MAVAPGDAAADHAVLFGVGGVVGYFAVAQFLTRLSFLVLGCGE
jgi:hypothetical protein